MTFEEAKKKYIKKFGGYPSFLLMGADEDFAREVLEKCLKSGKELEPDDVYGDY